MDVKRLLTMQAILSVAMTLAGAMFVPYLVSLGYTSLEIVLLYVVYFAVPVGMLALARNWRIKNYMLFGLAVRAASYLLMIWADQPLMILATSVSAIMITDYWVIFNTLYEESTRKGNRVFLNNAALSLFPIAGMFIPIIAAWLADTQGYWILFVGGVVLMLPAFYIAAKAGERRINIDLLKADRENTRIREVVLLEGFADGTIWIVPSLVTLTFVTGNIEFGAFFSYLGLAGVASAFIMGKLSDQSGKRHSYISVITILHGIALLVSGFANTLWVWALAMGADTILDRLQWPFTWALTAETGADTASIMVAREFWLNVGRLIASVATVACFFVLGNVQQVFILGGIALLFYPVFMRLRKL